MVSNENYTRYNNKIDRSALMNDRVKEFDIKKKMVSNWDVCCLVFSIITHVVDVILDITLAVRYLLNDRIAHFIWTIVFVFVPTIVVTVMSMKMYKQDQELYQNATHVSKKFKARDIGCCLVGVFFHLTPILRYGNALNYAIQSRKYEKLGDSNKQKQYYLQMLREDQDAALLRVTECFLEAAPQQILQLTILLKNLQNVPWFEITHQSICIASSLVSMASAMATYHRSIRATQRDKFEISSLGISLQFCWHLLITVSRILAITMVAILYVPYAVSSLLLHWFLMLIWIGADSHGIHEFCRNKNRAPHIRRNIIERISSFMFVSVLSVIYIFIYLNPTDGRTFRKYFFYYTLCLLENIFACLYWMLTPSTDIRFLWYFQFLPLTCISFFLLGIVIMILYYVYFHPSLKQKNVESLEI
ncbi:XK-related protein 4 [Orussus abietinus]|uniref:XK-related protein 4 n=1 Tax=Orussus abietinus TaxID=222816 RepID=UPI000626478F|nr:XK-related protein 4 [Orussus abietinus]